MQIVTDSGTDVFMSSEQMKELRINVVPLNITLDGKTYRDGVDIKPQEFYPLLAGSKGLPKTSQPSPGDFVNIYRNLAKEDPEILSIHMSSGLSGTLNAAQVAARMVPEANITHVDTKTLSVASGWQVEAAARAIKKGWPKEKILDLLKRIGDATEIVYTLKELKYLIHGGRISHIKGLIASVLNIKPFIGVEKERGTYIQLGQAITFERAIAGIVDLIAKQHQPGSALRVQVMHTYNPESANVLRDMIDKIFKCTWLPTGSISVALGAHPGPSMIGVVYAPASVFEEIS
ncbi:MAG: DegV family protein [Dehalococcoidales bacterium]|nr:DegV family protein [Dehalococcoidales bacterium]